MTGVQAANHPGGNDAILISLHLVQNIKIITAVQTWQHDSSHRLSCTIVPSLRISKRVVIIQRQYVDG